MNAAKAPEFVQVLAVETRDLSPTPYQQVAFAGHEEIVGVVEGDSEQQH